MTCSAGPGRSPTSWPGTHRTASPPSVRWPEGAAVFADESRSGMPSEEAVFGIGIGMALPVIRDHGSTALRRRFIGPGLRGDDVWCQLYSEPNAGSDLASLATRAVRDGDEW